MNLSSLKNQQFCAIGQRIDERVQSRRGVGAHIIKDGERTTTVGKMVEIFARAAVFEGRTNLDVWTVHSWLDLGIAPKDILEQFPPFMGKLCSVKNSFVRRAVASDFSHGQADHNRLMKGVAFWTLTLSGTDMLKEAAKELYPHLFIETSPHASNIDAAHTARPGVHLSAVA